MAILLRLEVIESIGVVKKRGSGRTDLAQGAAELALLTHFRVRVVSCRVVSTTANVQTLVGKIVHPAVLVGEIKGPPAVVGQGTPALLIKRLTDLGVSKQEAHHARRAGKERLGSICCAKDMERIAGTAAFLSKTQEGRLYLMPRREGEGEGEGHQPDPASYIVVMCRE